MKDKKSMVMIIIIGITLSLFLCFNTTVFATTGTVTTNDLRLRKDKSTSSEILELLDENTEVEVISEDGDWCKIKSENKVGYVSKQYIKVKDNNNTTKNEVKNETNENKNTTTKNVVNNTTEQNNVQQNTTTENVTQEQNHTENQTQNNEPKIKQATVSEEVSIRIIPLINSDEINKTKSGEKYEVLSSAGAWSYIKNESKEGWVLTAKISVTEQTTSNNDENNTKNQDNNNNDTNTTTENNNAKTDENKKDEDKKSETTSKTYYVKGTSVNARSEANKSSSVVKKFDTNDKVTVTGEDGDWYIVDINGKKAYCFHQKRLKQHQEVQIV